MSNDWKKQLAELSKNEEFQKKQNEIAEKFKDDEATIKEEITKLMAEYGITEPEGGFVAQAKELSDEELGAVSGGGWYYGGTCFCFMGGGGEAGPALCVCVAAGGGSDAYKDSSLNGKNGGGCGCAAFGWGEITGED